MAPVRAYVHSPRLQEHRTRLDLTQEAVAEELARLAWVHYGMRVGVNADMVGKWERGEKRPSKLYRRLLCLLYQATEEELGLRGPISDVNRRNFLRQSALAGAAFLTMPRWLRRGGATEASDRLAWALEQPSRVDLATVSDMETITAAHRRSYRQLSVHALLPQTESQFQAVTELLQRPQPLTLRQRLIATAGETAMLAGTLRFMDLDDFELGHSNLELAMTAAQEAEARELGAFVLGCMGFHARYSGNRKEAVDLIDQARTAAARVASPLTQGWLAAVASEVHAVAGDAAASLRALEQPLRHSTKQMRTTRAPGSGSAPSTRRSWRPITVSATSSLADPQTPYLPSPEPSTHSTRRSRSIGVLPWPTSPPGSSNCVKSRKAASGRANH
jgi:transcriptional regulator with XRE-family HTH domain